MTEKGRILKSASAITLVTLISRICGYLRDQRVVLLLGTSTAADAFVLAFRIPNLIRRMVGEGSLGASFIPVFTRTLRDKPIEQAWALAQRMFWILAAGLAAVSMLAIIFSKQVIYVFTVFGAHRMQWDLAIFLNRIIFPSVIFIGLAALAMAILNSFHVFALPASTGVVFNLAVILFSFAFLYRPIMRWTPQAFRSPAVAIAIGILLGSVLQLGIQIPALVRRGMRFAPAISFADPGVRTIGKLMGPSFFGMGVYQINFFVDTIFATSSRMPSGSITSLYVADRVMELVLGSYAIAMSTALLPLMSRQVAAGKIGDMKRTFAFSLRIVSFITIPAAVGLILLRHPIIQVLFQHGHFVAESTTLTARALLYYSLGLPAFAAIKLITPMYFSAQDTWTPAKIGAWALGVNIALNAIFLVTLVRVLSNGSPALASTAAAYFNFAALFLIFRRRYGRLGARQLLASIGKMAVCAVAMAAGCIVVFRFSNFFTLAHFVSRLGWLAAMIAVSVAIYFGLAWILRCEELPELFLLLRRHEPAVTAASESGFN